MLIAIAMILLLAPIIYHGGEVGGTLIEEKTDITNIQTSILNGRCFSFVIKKGDADNEKT